MPGINGLIDKYLLRECLRLFAVLGGLILAILLIERLIRIVELVANSEDGGVASFRMIADLVPHYLQLAIPAALFLAMIISIERLSRSGELVTMLSAGMSLRQLSRPFFVLALLAAALSLLVSGFVQPLTRYDYRQTVHDIQTQSFRAAFQEGRFVQFGAYTVWTDYRDFAGTELGETFILETGPDGGERYVSAPRGALLATGEDSFALRLEDGRGATLPTDDERSGTETLLFENIVWPVSTETAGFRARGNDERELMLTELPDVLAYRDVDQRAAWAAFNDRINRALLVLVLPLLAFQLGLNIGRKPKAGGIVLGIIILLVVQKALESGLHMAGTGLVPVWAGSWPIMAAVAALGLYLFSRASGEPVRAWLALNGPSRTVRNDDLAFSHAGRSE